MRPGVLNGLVICTCLALQLGSCRAPAESQAAPETSTENHVQPVPVRAVSAVDNLRVRAEPYLDSAELGRLMKGDAVVVESRTQWTQVIDSLKANWYFSRAERFSGWVFGGYLDFQTDSNRLTVPVDPSLSAPGPVPDKGGNTNPDVLDPKSLPELRIPAYGMDALPDSSAAQDGVIGYDRLYNQLLIWYAEIPSSRLYSYLADESGFSFRIVAKSPDGKQFEVNYEAAELERYRSSYQGRIGGKLDALLVPFRPYGSIPEGVWEFYAFVNDENWPVAGGAADIKPPVVSLVSSPEPDPFVHKPNDRYQTGSRTYAFGWDENRSEKLQVALYYDTQNRDDAAGVLLQPVAARWVFPGKKGFWTTEFLLTKDFPKGRYWVAVAPRIDSTRQLSVFITSLQLE